MVARNELVYKMPTRISEGCIVRATLEKINEDIKLLWTGFQLKNQTHFGNDRNQFIQGLHF